MFYGTLSGLSKMTLFILTGGIPFTVANLILNAGLELFSMIQAYLSLKFDFWKTLINLPEIAFTNYVYRVAY
jgi:hypothetical protein